MVADNSEISQENHHHDTNNNDGSDVTLSKEDQKLNAYSKVLELLSTDPNYQRDVTLGKRIGFYKIGKELGSGNFSKVKLGVHVLTKEKVAIKIMDKSKMDQKSQKLLTREVENMDEMHHPNIVRLFEMVETLSKIYLILEFAGGGELYNHVIQQTKLEEEEAKRLFAQVLSGVIHMVYSFAYNFFTVVQIENFITGGNRALNSPSSVHVSKYAPGTKNIFNFMHENGIIHRDIKAENVFFAGPNWVKLGDFGFSTAINAGDLLNTFCGSPPYAAPELFKDTSYLGDYVDIWALGILLYFMLVGNTPFRGETVSELKRQILDGQFVIPDHVTPFGQDLINGVLKQDATARYTLLDMQSHYWMGKQHFPAEYDKFSLVPSEEEMNQKPEIKEIWNKLHSYGISHDMMKDAGGKGVRSSVVGTYRVVLYQTQSKLEQERKDVMNKHFNEQDAAAAASAAADKKSLTKRTSKLCVVL